MSITGNQTFLCGKMGAGKSTMAVRLADESNAVLISEDDWLAAHYPDDITSFDDYLTLSRRVRPFIKAHVQDILRRGTDVVMDFPANTARQRAWFVALCTEIGCDYRMVYLEMSDEQCLAQLAIRRKEQPERARFDTEETFRHVTSFFEPPGAGEALNMMTV